MTRVENLGQTFPRIHTPAGELMLRITYFRTRIPLRGENDKTRGGKYPTLEKKGDFLKCYLHNFKSYRYSITLELFETQCLKKNNPKNVSFSITDFVYGFYISYFIRFYHDVLK